MKTAIIMGAGPAGLTAAYELLTKTDVKPIIIEADNQPGGISKTVNYKDNLIDIGGHRFFSKSKKIIDWWLQFLPLMAVGESENIHLGYQNKTVDFTVNNMSSKKVNGNLMLVPRKSRIYYRKRFFDYPLQLNVTTITNLGFLKVMKIGLSYIKARLFPEKPEETLGQFFRNNFGKELYLTFFKDYTEKVWGVPCETIPSSWGKQRVKDLNISKAILHTIKSFFYTNKSVMQKGTSTSLIEQFLYPQKGPGQMWETVAQKIIELGGEIHYNTKIDFLTAFDNTKIASATCSNLITGNGFKLTGDYFFSSIPVNELILNMKQVILDPIITEVAQGLVYRDFIIVGILTKRINGDKNLITDNWIYLQDKGILAGRVQFFNNWSPFMVKDNNTTWMGVEYFCNDSDTLWNQDEEIISKKAIDEMEKLALIRKADVIDTTVIKVPKAYPSYTGTYNNFEVLQDYLNRFENLFPVGRNGMHRYNNSDHSMMSAMIAVENIIIGRKDKSNIWAVNLEEDYHEEN